jgi:iron complex transport system substrate-binding protein
MKKLINHIALTNKANKIANSLNISFLLLGIFLITNLLSCNKAKDDFTITDSNVYVSKNIKIKQDNHRIVSVSPQVTEILCDLGCMDRLIARTDFCLYPKSVAKVRSIGGITDANIEMIISLQPDIVITSSIFPKKLVTVLEDASLPVVSFKEGSKIVDMYKVMTILGDLTNRQSQADSLINICKERLAKVSSKCDSIIKTEQSNRPKVYYVVGFGAGGDFSAGENTYIDEIFTLAGGDNIAKSAKNWSFNKEELFKNQPDYIFVRKADMEKFKHTSPYSELKAVKANKVFGIDDLDLQTPRSIDAIEHIFTTIYKQK